MSQTAPQLAPDPPRAPLASPARALLFAMAAVLLWGISFPVSRVAVPRDRATRPGTFRFALAAALLWPLARRRGLRLDAADRPAILGLGLLGVTLCFALENDGLVFTTASHASLIVATVPLGSAAVEAFCRRRPPGLFPSRA